MTGYESKKASARDKLAQEPVAYLCSPDKNGLFELPTTHKACKDCFPVYTTPLQRPWVGLTDAESQLIYDMGRTPTGMMKMVEAMLKDKNT